MHQASAHSKTNKRNKAKNDLIYISCTWIILKTGSHHQSRLNHRTKLCPSSSCNTTQRARLVSPITAWMLSCCIVGTWDPWNFCLVRVGETCLCLYKLPGKSVANQVAWLASLLHGIHEGITTQIGSIIGDWLLFLLLARLVFGFISAAFPLSILFRSQKIVMLGQDLGRVSQHCTQKAPKRQKEGVLHNVCSMHDSCRKSAEHCSICSAVCTINA